MSLCGLGGDDTTSIGSEQFRLMDPDGEVVGLDVGSGVSPDGTAAFGFPVHAAAGQRATTAAIQAIVRMVGFRRHSIRLMIALVHA